MRMFLVARDGHKPSESELKKMSNSLERFFKVSNDKIKMRDNSPSILTIIDFDVFTIPDSPVERIQPVYDSESDTHLIKIDFQPLLAKENEDG